MIVTTFDRTSAQSADRTVTTDGVSVSQNTVPSHVSRSTVANHSIRPVIVETPVKRNSIICGLTLGLGTYATSF